MCNIMNHNLIQLLTSLLILLLIAFPLRIFCGLTDVLGKSNSVYNFFFISKRNFEVTTRAWNGVKKSNKSR